MHMTHKIAQRVNNNSSKIWHYTEYKNYKY